MCFETTESAKAKIAKTDIECWKYLNENGIPYINSSKGTYIPKKRNPIIHLEKDCNEIKEGYHSYKTRNRCKSELDWWERVANKGIIKKFIIPKGTRYFSNRTEYVSETIILV